MPIIPYPRIGQRLAPALLREILDVSVGAVFQQHLPTLEHLKLCDLDESVWRRFESGVCFDLAEAILQQVRGKWNLIGGQLGNHPLPKAPVDLSLELLPLEARTFHCIDSSRGNNPLVRAEEWARVTINDLVAIRNFGAKSLVDFLCSYESFVDDSAGAITHQYLDLGDEVLRNWIEGEVTCVPPEYFSSKMLPIPEGTTLNSLGLSHRTHRILDEQGYSEKLESLSGRTIAELMSLRGFGVTCLKDLLTVLLRHPSNANVHELSNSKPVELAWAANDVGGTDRFRQWLDNPIFPLPWRLQRSNLPAPPSGATAYSLGLRERTINCLAKRGFANRLASLTEMTIQDLLNLQGFGIEALKDLLRAWCRVLEPNSPMVPLAASSIEEELRSAILAAIPGAKPRTAAIAAQYFGFDGKKNRTLQEVGDIEGITRERVRQICETVARKLQAMELATPLLDKAIEVVEQAAPRRAEEIETELCKRGFSDQPYRLEGLIEAGRLLQRDIPFVVEEFGASRFALLKSQVSHFKQVARLARDLIRTWGVSTKSDLVARAKKTIAPAITSAFVDQVLRVLVGFSWLDESGGWFWIKGNYWNSLLTPIRKILAVAGRIELAVLHEGIGRHHSAQGLAPPRQVLLELCRQLPECRLENTVVIAEPPIDWREELEDVECIMTRILKENGSVMNRAHFEELCSRENINRSTFYAYLVYSPIIERLADGVYGLRGAECRPGLVESLKPGRYTNTGVRIDQGWSSESLIWVAYRISQSMLTNGFCSVPSEFKQHLRGKFALASSDGTKIGRFTIREYSGWGLKSLFKRRGGEPGDILLLQFDLNSRSVSAKIGGDELIPTES